jgi:hypothetical protein
MGLRTTAAQGLYLMDLEEGVSRLIYQTGSRSMSSQWRSLDLILLIPMCTPAVTKVCYELYLLYVHHVMLWLIYAFVIAML